MNNVGTFVEYQMTIYLLILFFNSYLRKIILLPNTKAY